MAWRLIYRIDDDAVVVLHQFMKKTRKTPRSIIKQCRQRLKTYDER